MSRAGHSIHVHGKYKRTSLQPAMSGRWSQVMDLPKLGSEPVISGRDSLKPSTFPLTSSL